ncbi:MAG: sulfatase-like hydrolase/transferase [Verrucomicrobiota bacterium]|nr:sulfatase-like hydrolase/transferase [Verrucomicrobiota bacterium]
MRILFLLLIFIAFTLSAADRPNIVLVMCDDLGWGDVGFNGNKVIRTPHLDVMANASLKFTRFYAAAPVCSPTRGSCITGRHPYRYGVYFANTGHMKSEELTLAELLKKHGYATGHFGKWHLGTLTKTEKDANRGGPKGVAHFSPPQVNGFDVCFSTESKVPTFDPMLRPKGIKGKTWWDPAKENGAYGTGYWNEQGERVTKNLRGDDSRIIMDRAIPFIRSAAKKGKSFFAIIWFHAPHLPVVAGPEHTKLYAKYDKYSQHYFGCITALDEQVGRLRKELRVLGAEENTFLTFCSDNGPEGQSGKAPGTAGHLSGRKRSLLEGGIRVPGLIEWPGKIRPGNTTIPAVTSDYLPTILDILGVEHADKRPLDGVSLLPLIKGNMKSRGKPIGFQSAGQIALIGDRYKIYGKGAKREKTGKLPTLQLFDLLNDPSERENLSTQHPGLVEQMGSTFKEWQASCRHSVKGGDYQK